MTALPVPASPASGDLAPLLPPGATLVLYDGLCGLCNGFVRFALRHDRRARLRYAALQSDLARSIAAAHGAPALDLDTVQVVVGYATPEERLLVRSRAVLAVLRALGGCWAFLARAVALLPTALLDAGYDFVARHRYRVFGHYETCPIPKPEHRARFVDVG